MTSNRFSAWTFLGMMVAAFAAATAVGGMAVFLVTGGAEQGLSMVVAYVLQFGFAIAAGAWCLARMGGVRFDLCVGRRDALVAAGGVVLLTAAGIVIEPLLGLFPDRYMKELDDMISSDVWMGVLTVVAAPVLEELFFRGVVLEGLSRRWGAAAAVAASAALFGAAHLPNLPQMVNAFVMACVMGCVYVLAGRRLAPVILIHAANNAVAYTVLRLTGSQTTDTRGMIGNNALYWALYAVSAAVFVASMVVMVRRVRNKTLEKDVTA